MVAAGAMAFSSIFVVTNSLRLRGYDVQKLQTRKPLPRQLVEFAPRLAAPAIALALLIAVSIGWLMPAQANDQPAGGTGRKTITYRARIDQPTRIVTGRTAPLDLKIVDQFGKPFADFDSSPLGRIVSVAAVSRDLNYVGATSVQAPISGAGGMGGSGMAGAANAPAPGKTPTPAAKGRPTPVPGLMRPPLNFPSDGQYTVFVNFWPRGSEEQVGLVVPVTVGSGEARAVALTPDTSLTKTVGDLTVTLKTEGPLKARQYNYVEFEVLDAQGQPRSGQIEALSANLARLDVVDEKLTTFLQPDFINRQKLRFSVNFPKPGRYKLWFSFYSAGSADLNLPPETVKKNRAFIMRNHPNQQQQLPFVVEVQ
jgi:hypothetical protein